MKEILVTGGNGFVGRHLVPALQDRGDRVRVLALPAENTSWLEERGVVVHRGDIRLADTLQSPMRGVDGVLNLAGMMGVWRPMRDYYAVNVTGAENVCRAARAEGVGRVVHVSSWTVYGMGLGRLVREDLPLVYVSDVIQGLLLALDHSEAVGQAYNIGNDQPLTQRQFLEAIAREAGLTPPQLHIPYPALYAAAYVSERLAMLTRSQRDPLVTRHGVALFGTDNRHAVDKARRELGYAPRVDLPEGVSRAAAWYKQRESLVPTRVPAASRQ